MDYHHITYLPIFIKVAISGYPIFRHTQMDLRRSFIFWGELAFEEHGVHGMPNNCHTSQ